MIKYLTIAEIEYDIKLEGLCLVFYSFNRAHALDNFLPFITDILAPTSFSGVTFLFHHPTTV